jgi:hypothetical protein
MRRRGNGLISQLVLASCLATTPACAPIVDVAGVYFPGWLVSAVTAVAASYGVVLWLGRRPGAKTLADSGIFFVSLASSIALAVWWMLFSRF